MSEKIDIEQVDGIGALESLTTTNKSNLVNAINEVNSKHTDFGGVNLSGDSHFYNGSTNGWSSVYGTQVVENHIYKKTFATLNSSARIERVFTNLKAGIYTLTIFVKTPVAISWYSFVNGTPITGASPSSPNEFTRRSVTFSVNTDGNVTVRGYVPSIPVGSVIEIDWFKLETGYVGSDWTPTLEEQKSDWNETNPFKDSYIKNKPEIPNVTGFVPYTGADQPINLNTQQLTSGTQFLNNTKSFSIKSNHLGSNNNIPGYFKINLTPNTFYGTTFNLTISGGYNSTRDYGIVQFSGTLNPSTDTNGQDFIFHTVKGYTGGVTVISRGFYIEPKQYIDENGIYYIKAWKRPTHNINIYVDGNISVGSSDTNYEPNIEFVEDATPVTLYNIPNYITENQGRYVTLSGESTIVDGGRLSIVNNDHSGWFNNTVGDSERYYTRRNFSIESSNNQMSFFINGAFNSRRAGIQVGHNGGFNNTGILELNPFGGTVRINGEHAWHGGNFNPAQYVLQSALNTQLANYVPINGVTTINNTKTFTSSPIVPTATLNGHAVNLGQLNTILGDYATEEWVNSQGFSTQTLIAGDNISIVDNVISATDTTYTAGTGISISDNVITNTAPNATHTGDVTGATYLSIANNAVTNPKMAQMNANSIKGRAGSIGNPQDLTPAQVRTMLNVQEGANRTRIGINGGNYTEVGDINLIAGSNVSLSKSGENITINSASQPIDTTVKVYMPGEVANNDTVSCNASKTIIYLSPTFTGPLNIAIDPDLQDGAWLIVIHTYQGSGPGLFNINGSFINITGQLVSIYTASMGKRYRFIYVKDLERFALVDGGQI